MSPFLCQTAFFVFGFMIKAGNSILGIQFFFSVIDFQGLSVQAILSQGSLEKLHCHFGTVSLTSGMGEV